MNLPDHFHGAYIKYFFNKYNILHTYIYVCVIQFHQIPSQCHTIQAGMVASYLEVKKKEK